MIKVTVPAAPVEVISYIDKASGSPRELRKQVAYAHVYTADGKPAPFPEKFGFILPRDADPYAPGEYALHPSAVQIDRDGRLSCLPRLAPLKATA